MALANDREMVESDNLVGPGYGPRPAYGPMQQSSRLGGSDSTPLNGSLGDLDNVLNELEDQARLLNERLGVILRPEIPSPDGMAKEQKNVGSNLAMAIGEEVNKGKRVRAMLRDIISRIDL